MPKFVHSALQDPRKQIRLLSLNADADPVDLRCSLSTYDLHNAPEFVALSYECGSPDSAVDIIVNGRAYTIRHNLSLLLTHIQRRPQCLDAIADELLWVDAICISQTNIDERNAQVAIMGTIYQAAARTYAWLGWPHQFDPYLVYNLMMDAASPANQDSIAQYSAAISSNKMLMGTGMIELLSQVLKWCSSSYFNRRWVVQELFLSKMVILVCGESAIRMPLIKPFMRVVKALVLGDASGERSHLAEPIQRTLPYIMARFLDEYAHKPHYNYEQSLIASVSSKPTFLPPKASLRAVLLAFEETRCERIHDHLYAVLTLVEGGEKIPVDYLLRPEQLLCQVLSQRGWSDMTSVKATAKALGLANPTSRQAADAVQVTKAPDGDLVSHALLEVGKVTRLGRLQTVIQITERSRRLWKKRRSRADDVSRGDVGSAPWYRDNPMRLNHHFDPMLHVGTTSWQERSRHDNKPDEDALVVYVSDRGHVGACKSAQQGDVLCSLHGLRRRSIILREQKQRAQGQNYFRVVT